MEGSETDEHLQVVLEGVDYSLLLLTFCYTHFVWL